MGRKRAPNGDPPGQLPTAALVALTADLTRAGDADAVARTLARRLVELCDAADVDVWRLVGDALHCVASCERGGRFDDSVLGTVLDLDRAAASAWTVEHGEPLILPNADDPRLSPMERSAYEEYGFVTSLSIPLVIEETTVGLVDLYDDRPRDWSRDVGVATMVAQTAAGVFRASLALEEARESNASLRTLVDAAVEIGSSLDFDAVLDSVARKMCQVSGAVACELFSVDGDDVTSLIYVVDGESRDVDVGRVYDEREYHIRSDELLDPRLIEVPDIAAETEASAAEVDEWLKNGWHSGVVIPLLAGGAVIGQAFVYDRQPRLWGGLDTLRGLAQIAAQAMYNAALHRETTAAAERLRTANEIGLQLVSQRSVDETTAITARRLCRMLDAANCDIWEFDDGELHCLLSIDEGRPDDRWIDARVVASEWPTWMGVIESGKPLLIDDVTAGSLSAAERAWFAESGTASTLLLPLLGRAGFRGTLEFYRRDAQRRFAAHDLDVAGAYTAVVTLALENARLFEDLRARRWEAELINRLARETSASLDVAEISAAALEALADTVPCERAAVVLAGDDGALAVVQARPERC
ncbi:MAG: GAF domain-containing protein, partial [Actinobacteria bacterium]|nr:GAF domain-containing protein [Actinomycetota bacterium]